MPTTQELPQTPLEGAGFFQDGVGPDTVEPRGEKMAAAQEKAEQCVEKESNGRTLKRKGGQRRPINTDTMVRPPEEKRVKFNLQDTVVTEDDHQQLQGDSEHDGTALQLHGTGSCDPSGDAPPTAEDIETCTKRVKSETQSLFDKWKNTFRESEAFESFFPSRVDELIREACAVEESLKEKKEAMRKRLSAVASTLSSLGTSHR